MLRSEVSAQRSYIYEINRWPVWLTRYRIQDTDPVFHYRFCFSDEESPVLLVKLHVIADKEEGWLQVVSSMVNVIPLDNPLGPSAITIVFDDCPLPSRDSVIKVCSNYRAVRKYLAYEFINREGVYSIFNIIMSGDARWLAHEHPLPLPQTVARALARAADFI